jgi:hypothetical protein
MAFAFAQRSAELKAKPPWVEPASYADQVRAALVCAADASQGPVSVLEIIRPAVPHGRESTAEAWNWVGLIGSPGLLLIRE